MNNAEIIKALRACGDGKAACARCPFDEPAIDHWYPQCLFRAVATAAAALAKCEKEADRLRAELEAAKRDMRELSGHYKICKFCMYDKGGGVSDCKDYKCDSENHYVWRGLCAENGGAPNE